MTDIAFQIDLITENQRNTVECSTSLASLAAPAFVYAKGGLKETDPAPFTDSQGCSCTPATFPLKKVCWVDLTILSKLDLIECCCGIVRRVMWFCCLGSI